MRYFVSLWLCFCLAVSGVTYAPPRAFAAPTSPAAEADWLRDLEDLRQAILNQSASRMDRYQLLRQAFIASDSPVVAHNTLVQIFSSHNRLLASELFRRPISLQTAAGEKITRLEISHSQQPLHQLSIEADALVWNERFIVWMQGSASQQQRLHFIDLDFVPLGKSALPIFNFPLHGFEAGQLKFQGRDLWIGNQEIAYRQLVDLSKINQMAFSLSVNLLDVSFAETTKELIAEFRELFLQMAQEESLRTKDRARVHPMHVSNVQQMIGEVESSLKEEAQHLVHEIPMLGRLQGDKKNEVLDKLRAHFANAQGQSEVFMTQLEQSLHLQEALKNSATARNQHRLLSARLHEFFLQMAVPRPEGVPVMRDALYRVAAGIKLGQHEQFLEAFYIAYAHKPLRYGFMAMASVGMAVSFPQEMAWFFHQGLQVAGELGTAVIDKAGDFVYLVGQSAKATFSGFHPSVFSEVYFADGRWAKTLTGLSALLGVMFVTLGVPHLLINSIKLAKDLRAFDYSSLRQNFPAKWQALYRLKQAFVSRQMAEEKDYIRLIQEAEPVAGLEAWVFTDAENAEVQKLLAAVEAKDFQQSRWLRWARWMAKKEDQSRKQYSIASEDMSFRAALTHFLFSFASFTNSGIVYATIWNYWFILRSIVFRPTLLPYLMIYPKLFRRAVLHKAKAIQIPTAWNGGLQAGLPFLSALMSRWQNKERHQQMESLERAIVDFERQALQKILPKAFRESLRYSKSLRDFESISAENIQNYTDKQIARLSFRSKIFFQWYVHLALDKLVEEQLVQTLGIERGASQSVSAYKRELLESANVNSFRFPAELNPTLLVESLERFDIAAQARERAERGYWNLQNQMQLSLQKKLFAMDSRYSGQFGRFATAADQMQKPKAVARAVRSSIVKMVVDKPMELLFLFIMVAGTQGDLVQPIHDQMFSENSWFYLSRYQFLSGFAYGMVSGLLADTWMKLQQDARIDQLGGFQNIPKGQRAKRGFWYNYAQEFQASDNSWWQNQVFYAKLIWANMGAALVTMATVQWFTLGRLDLDIYIAGYLVAYFSPLSGLGFKLENAFEKAANWVVRDIPEEFHKHPAVIKYSAKALARLRIRYNFFYSVYENTIGHWLGNFSNMTTDQLGPRSFSRWVGGGFTFTELLVNHMDALAEKYSVAEKPANWCRAVLLNNYTAGVKLNKK